MRPHINMPKAGKTDFKYSILCIILIGKICMGIIACKSVQETNTNRATLNLKSERIENLPPGMLSKIPPEAAILFMFMALSQIGTWNKPKGS